MKLLDLYLARALVSGTLLVLLVLVSLDAVFALIGELGKVGRGNYDLTAALSYVGLTLPQRILRMFPTAVLLGCLVSLGQLAANSELTVMQAAGVSRRRIVVAVLKGGALMVVLALVFSEWVVPPSEQSAQTLRADAMSNRAASRVAAGLWVRDANAFVNIDQVLPGNLLRGVTVYRFGESGMREAVSAESAKLEAQGWVLRDLRYSRFIDDRVVTEAVAQETWPSLINPELVRVLAVRPESMSGLRLFQYVAYLKGNGLDARIYELALWSKLLDPLSALAMLFVATPFIFGSQRGGGAGQRLVIGGVIGIAFFLFDRMFGHFALVFNMPVFLAASLPTVTCLAAGMVLLNRRT